MSKPNTQRLGVTFDNHNIITERDDLPGTVFHVVDENGDPVADIIGDRHSPEGIIETRQLAFLFAASEEMRDACKAMWEAVTPEEIAAAKNACGAAYMQAVFHPSKPMDLK